MSGRFSGSLSTVVAVLAVVLLVTLAGCQAGAEVPDAGVSDPADATTGLETTAGTVTAGNLSVHFIDVGQGSSVLVVGPAGETLLYDTGDWRDDGEHVLEYLRAHNVTRIDYLVTSHADADHVGGHAAVIDYYETEAGGVGAIYDPGIAAGTGTYEEYLDAVERYDVTLYRAQAGDRIPMDAASVEVLSPPEGYLAGRERNENSLVLRVEYGNVSVLLPGDAEVEAERYLTDTYDARLNATILAVGHHGSNTSTGPVLLGEVTPRVAVVQSAYDSPYGHPHRDLLARLAERGIPTYWTGVHGTVVFETDGRTVVVRTRSAAPTAPVDLRSASAAPPGIDGPLIRRATFAVDGGPVQSASGTVGTDGGESKRSTSPDGATTTSATTTSGEPTAAASESLVVTEVHADALGDEYENLNDEYVVFRNAGDRTLDLSGWTVADEAGHRYTFPAGTTLAPGETLALHTGRGTDDATDYYWGSERPVWNNGGDTVFVRTDEGTLVVEVEYDG